MRNNRECCICGKEYSYCNTCSADARKPTWYNSFDNENCKEIYEVCAGYWMKHIGIEEATERIVKCDLSLFDSFSDSTKKIINELLEYNRKKENKPIDGKKIEETKKASSALKNDSNKK